MTCRSCRQQMVEFATDGIDPDRAAAWRSHLDACPACASEWQAIAEVDSLLAVAAAPVPVSEVLLARVREQVATELDAPPPAVPLLRWMNLAALSGAACVLLGLLGLIALRQTASPPAPVAHRLVHAPANSQAPAAAERIPAETLPPPVPDTVSPDLPEPAPPTVAAEPRPAPPAPVVRPRGRPPRRPAPRRERAMLRETRLAAAPAPPLARPRVEPPGRTRDEEETSPRETFEPRVADALAGPVGASGIFSGPARPAPARLDPRPRPESAADRPIAPSPSPVATVAWRPPAIEIAESGAFALRAAEPSPAPAHLAAGVTLVVEPALLESEAFPAAAVAARIR